MIDPVVPFIALLSALLVLLPLPWHIKSGNVGTVALAIWLFIGNLDIFINSMMWWKSSDNKYPAFCEISVRVRYAMAMAIPACNLAIARRLEGIASTRQVRMTLSERKRQLWIELGLTVGLPVLYVALMIVNQSYRYNIIEGIGCWPAMWISWVWVVLSAVPSIAVSVASLIYSALSFRWFWIRRRQFQAVLASNASSLNKSRYIRMLALTAVDMVIFFPIYIVGISLSLKTYTLLPYDSWAQVHAGFNRVESLPAFVVEQQTQSMVNLILSRWVGPVAAITFFVMFGMGHEARQVYSGGFGLKKLVKNRLVQKTPKTSDPVTVDIEVVTFQADNSISYQSSPSSEKFCTSSHKSEER
ncbi:pheromone receptor a1 [Testicularia cyperi]|uniref:Pheromone receptor a1 n=1 Tax=Testicularia cyperi TaxID=1882483 RepID=A0A317XU79_9BASI|nr:pheromone receptor a1 [Testicularia cyperi]DBA11508.1 TPA_inf: STE3 [Testicularia cyperi]